MEPHETWAAMRKFLEDLACPPSYTSDLFTPPLSPLDPPREGTRDDIEPVEDLCKPYTPSPQTFGIYHSPTHKDVEQTVRIADPFTPLSSRWPTPLFSDSTPPASNRLHKSRSSFLRRSDIQIPHHSKPSATGRYQAMEKGAPTTASSPAWSIESLVILEEENNNLPPRRTEHSPPPPQIYPFIRTNRTQYRTRLSEPALTVTKQINLSLMRCCAVLLNGHPDCLLYADNALAMAEESGHHHLISKSQHYRGLSLMKLKRYKEASNAFTRAASIRDWAQRASGYKSTAERMVRAETIMKVYGKKLVLEDDDSDEEWDDNYR